MTTHLRSVRLTAILGTTLVTASALTVLPTLVATQEARDARLAREGINAMYVEWGQARVSRDKEVIERILAPEFHVLLDGQEIARDQFVSDVTAERPGPGGLMRFDAEVLTLQRSEDGWTIVITEKLEYEFPVDGGGMQKAYSYWVTRDGCRKEGDQWRVTYSEAIGYENWRSGEKPPIAAWED